MKLEDSELGGKGKRGGVEDLGDRDNEVSVLSLFGA